MKRFLFLFSTLFFSICLIQKLNAATLGDYRTISDSPIDWNDAAKWETYDGSAWIAAATPPTSSAGTISILHVTWIAWTDVTADQVVVETGGTLWVTGSASLYLNDGVGEDLIQNGGTLRLYSYIRKSGAGNPSIYINAGNTFEWFSNELGAGVTLTVPVGATALMGGSSDKINLGIVNNYGTLNWTESSVSILGGTSPGTINNYGTFNMTSDNNGSHSIYFIGQNLNNMASGIININLTYAFSQSTLYFQADALGGVCTNQGTINVHQGRLNFMEGGTQTGTFMVGSMARLDFWTSDVTFGTGTNFTGTGEVRKYCNWILAADITLNNPFLYWGFSLSGSGGNHSLTLQGVDTLQSCTLYETASIVVAAGASLLIRTFGTKDIRGTIDIKGTLTWVEGQFNGYGATYGTIHNEANFILNTSTTDLYSYDVNWTNSFGSSTTIMGGGTVFFTQNFNGISYTGNGALDIQAGTLSFNAPATHNSILAIADFATLDINNSQTFVFNYSDLPLNGQITGGYFVMNSSAAQDITAGLMGLHQIDKLRINNTSGVFLANLLTINNGLDFVDGMLHIQDATLRLSPSITSGTDSTQYIMTDGLGVVAISLAAGNAATYFVGSPLSYMPLTITQSLTATSDFYAVRCINEMYNQYDLNDAPIGTAVSTYAVRGTWLVSESDPGGVDITLTACWTQSSELPSFDRNNNVYFAHFTNSAWDAGTAGAATQNGNLFCISRSGITSLSPFAVANHNPLPVETLDFSANLSANQSVQLKWTTFSEKNTEKFILERENAQHTFDVISEVKAVGNSNIIQMYETLDNAPLVGKNSYRLRSIDINGIEQVQGKINILFLAESAFSIYPNPFSTDLTISSQSMEDEANISVMDNTGRIIYQETHLFSPYHSQYSFATDKWAAGLYHLKIVQAGKVMQIPIMKQ
jgi:Secretion system C-terminal sorting domain